MHKFLLEHLTKGHKRFERLFKELERQCDATQSGLLDPKTLHAIAQYLGSGALLFHHALEDAIYAKLLQYQPRFREIYDLAADHRQSMREFEWFGSAVSGSEEDPFEATRSFIGNERGHFISEEEIFFPQAAKCLQSEDWRSLEQNVPAAELLITDIEATVDRLCEGGD